MKKYKGAVFFDVDGTLVDERQGIFQPTPKVVTAIQQLKENGYLTGIATGRAQCYIPDIGVDFDCYISSNGAAAEVDGQTIFNDMIPVPKLKELIAYMEQEGIGYALEGIKCCYVQPTYKTGFDMLLKNFGIPSECFYPLEDLETAEANKILVVFQNLDQLERFRSKYHEEFVVLQHHRNLSADINKRKVSKATGIQAVIEHFNLDIKNTYAFGDDSNDFEMLETVGHGVAMTPHAPGLDKVADSVTCGVAEDGVYHGVKRLGLI